VCLSGDHTFTDLQAALSSFDGTAEPMVEIVDGAGRFTIFKQHKDDFLRHCLKGEIRCEVLPKLTDDEFMRCVHFYGEDAGKESTNVRRDRNSPVVSVVVCSNF
jgi:hypothetical protein